MSIIVPLIHSPNYTEVHFMSTRKLWFSQEAPQCNMEAWKQADPAINMR